MNFIKHFFTALIAISSINYSVASEEQQQRGSISIEQKYSGAQPTSDELLELARAGVKHVINLRPISEQLPYNEAADATRYGMAYYNIPISGTEDLSKSSVLLLDRTLKKFGDEGFILHCSSGNRVGALMALRAAWVGGATTGEAIRIGRQWGLTRLENSVKNRLREPLTE